RSSAELSAEEKNARSHRGQALAELARQLCELQ
ncbi:MAG: non-canonical purine NTP pyrophosphatase, partial [Gammaproteobacteria bacterium]|nr:non-canonical purine NTP pyrophosphatase [Gammaproteobacteria bacterium]